MKRCREYNTLFDAEKVETIFSNIECIYEFQRDFLKELEARVNMDRMEDSQIGDVFVLNVSPLSSRCVNIGGVTLEGGILNGDVPFNMRGSPPPVDFSHT